MTYDGLDRALAEALAAAVMGRTERAHDDLLTHKPGKYRGISLLRSHRQWLADCGLCGFG